MTETSNVTLTSGDALIIVDIQKDFVDGGALAVPDGQATVEPTNEYSSRFETADLLICATRDWHPEDHCSFTAQGGIWPAHCIANSDGAAFSPDLRLPNSAAIVSKATEQATDAYSGFEGTTLDQQLRDQQIGRVFVCGLATDYCVLNTVRDARRLGYDTFLLIDAIAAVNIRPDDGARAVAEMVALGAVQLQLANLALPS